MTSRIGAIALALTAWFLVAGCGPTAPPSPAPPAIMETAAAGTAPAAEPLPEDIAHAISQRQLFGLRSDEAWVRQVAADPRASINLLDFPMLPEEEAEFQDRQSDFEQVATAVNAYAVGRGDEFGGVWIDQERHTVVAAWTANAELHRIGILAQLGGFGPLEVRLVAHAEQDLAALQDRIVAERAWLDTIPAAFISSGVMTMENRVTLDVSSANPDAEALIMAHFGVGPDMLLVHSDGTGILLQPRGTVQGTVVTAAGAHPGRNDYMLAWTPDRPGSGDCGSMVGEGVPEDGRFELPCAPGGWTIAVQQSVGDGWVDIGRGHVVVPPGGEVELRITLDP